MSFRKLFKRIKDDPELWRAWKANIAVYMVGNCQSSGIKHKNLVEACNKGADDFLTALTSERGTSDEGRPQDDETTAL